MNEARDIIRKLLPHLRTLSLYASRDELYEVKAIISDADEFLANNENEHVIYQFQAKDGRWHSFINDSHYKSTVEDGRWPIRALYAEPPARKPLHYFEIDGLIKAVGMFDHLANMREFARAIEAAHGIK